MPVLFAMNCRLGTIIAKNVENLSHKGTLRVSGLFSTYILGICLLNANIL
jgi:hypothetical protein